VKSFLTKNSVVIGLGLVLVFLIFCLAFSTKSRNADNSLTVTPHEEVLDVKEKQDEITSKETYKAQIKIGGIVLDQIFEKWTDEDDWEYGKYRFFTTDEEPKLLKEVPIFTPPIDADEALNTNFFLRDITGDDIEELFMRILRSGSNLSEWEILKLEGGSLVNITVKGRKDNPTWVTFDDIGNRGDYVWLDWHGSDMRGRTLYRLEANELVEVSSVRIRFANGGDECSVSVKNENDTDFIFVEGVMCENIRREDGTLNFGKYFLLDLVQIRFLSTLYEAKSNPKLSTLAKTYSEHCEAITDTAIVAGVDGFYGLIQEAGVNRPTKTTPNGQVLILPCGRGAYQDWDLPVFYDGNTYTPLTVEVIGEDGERITNQTATEFGYNIQTDTFTSHAKGNGVNSCWTEGEYKLVGRELVIQKFSADWDCEDQKGRDYEGEVVYNINE
jgi:hypothetical protein